MSTNKKAAFLVYVENQTDFEKFLKVTDYLNGDAHRLNFKSKTDKLKSHYIIADVVNDCAMWGGNDLRPFGYYTKEYCSINKGAITVDSFIEISRLLSKSRIPSKEYIVPVNDEILNIIRNDDYTLLHRPYFGMQGSTHSLFTLNPLSQTGLDAAKIGSANISQDEFLNLYFED